MEHRLIFFRERPERRIEPELPESPAASPIGTDEAHRQLLREQRREAARFIESRESEFTQGFDAVVTEFLQKSRGKDFAVIDDLSATSSFMKLPAVQELSERYHASSANVRELLVRRVAEFCDRACKGQPEQHVIFRQLLRSLPPESSSADGNRPQTNEELNPVPRESDQATLGFDVVSDREIDLAVSDVLPRVKDFLLQTLDDGTADGSSLARLLHHDSPDVSAIKRSLDHSGLTQRTPVRVLRWLHNRMTIEDNPKMQQAVEASVTKVSAWRTTGFPLRFVPVFSVRRCSSGVVGSS